MTTSSESSLIHRYGFPLGRGAWLTCEYRKTPDGYKWTFTPGGSCTPQGLLNKLVAAISLLPRFGAMPDAGLYSVGRHSWLLALYLRLIGQTIGARLLSLVHDMSEPIGVGDMNTHLKRLIGKGVSSYEDDLIEWLLVYLDLAQYVTAEDRTVVHALDKVFGASEARLLDMDNGEGWLVSLDNPVYLWLANYDLHDTHDAYPVWMREYHATLYTARLPKEV